MSDRQASSLRDTVASLPSGRSRRYSRALKGRIMDVVHARREEGASGAQLSEQLGVSLETLRRWSVDAPPKTASRMRRVHVLAERKASVVSVVSCSGHRVEGPALSEVKTGRREKIR